MPGLNQLKKFSDDIKIVGDEEKIRAQRGERPASIPLPSGISEDDDSDDFIIGMPELPSTESEEEAAPTPTVNLSETVDVPDVDSIIAGVLNEAKQEEKEQPVAEETENSPEVAETPIEDMDLASLLNTTGNSGMDMIDEADLADFEEDIPVDTASSSFSDAAPPETDETPQKPSDDALAQNGSDDALNELLAGFDSDIDMAGEENPSELSETLPPENDAQALDTLESLDGLEEPAFESDSSELNLEPASENDTSELNLEPAAENDTSELKLDSASENDSSDLMSDPAQDSLLSGLASDIESSPSDDSGADALSNLEMFDTSALDDFNLGGETSPDFNGGEIPGEEPSQEAQDAAGGESDESPDASPLAEENADFGVENQQDEMSLDAMNLDGDFSTGDDSALATEVNMTPDSEDNAPVSSDADNPADTFDTSALDDFNFGGGGEIPDATQDVPGEENSVPQMDESFDMSEMEGVDFSKPAGGEEFPVTGEGQEAGGDDDFILDNNFEIPGFSDTETADMGKKRPAFDTVDFSGSKAQHPKNSLTDDEYVQFKKILANYPLNLRLAIEDVISSNDFTDDAVFELIEKILKKTSARQVATHVEKMLDVTIDVPRDYERRSFAQYEAYKQSFQYQLKNRIIPAAIVGAILLLVCFGLFKASVAFIYNPVMASLNYKQGYTLLENNEFPQSEEKFKEAVSYKAVKKWFFKYAHGYREKKQYERAGQMYRNILGYFNHDKTAGLEYAQMELYDRANYERAEEIVRRQVLDYHINDPDGILLLGDVFLEWAEIDDSKYEDAKREYLDLMQRYGENFLYLSRLLRYYIRTDKLREVLTLKNTFYPDAKSLGADDWTELSGYLLDKLYGPLSRNDEYLRSSIEDVRSMLERAIKANPENPLARYNLSRYFVYNGYSEQAKRELEITLDLFDKLSVRTKKNVYREINATRILGELYSDGREYLKAQTVYTRGINLFNSENEMTGLEGDENTGKLFADMGDIDYFISGELDSALFNYEKAIATKNDTPSLNFRVGAIRYQKNDYDKALASFIKVSESLPKDPNLLLALANVLSVRGDNFAARSYYSDLLNVLDNIKAKQKVLFPQDDEDDYQVVDMYLKANNNLGVTLYRLARQSGNSSMNAEAMVRLSESNRAWDSLTRNQKTLVRMDGSNLAAQNSKYITHPYPDFEPAIYTDIPNILSDEKALE